MKSNSWAPMQFFTYQQKLQYWQIFKQLGDNSQNLQSGENAKSVRKKGKFFMKRNLSVQHQEFMLKVYD